jgi:hypothetical protein
MVEIVFSSDCFVLQISKVEVVPKYGQPARHQSRQQHNQFDAK